MSKRQRVNVNGKRKRRSNQRNGFVVRQPELKQFDVNVDVDITSTGGVLATPLNGILTGTTAASRVGNRVQIKRVAFRGHLHQTDTTDGTDIVRVIWFFDKQTSGSVAAIGEILNTTTTDSFRESDTTKRFIILHDEYMAWNAFMNNSTNPPTFFVDQRSPILWFKDVNLETQYLSSAATYAAISTGGIGILTISEETGSTSITGVFRVSYTDV